VNAKKRYSAGTLLWLGLIAMATAGQTWSSDRQVPSPQKPLQHEVAVTLKLIQIYVIDKQRRLVTDLAKLDFDLCNNGGEITVVDINKEKGGMKWRKQIPCLRPMTSRSDTRTES
jgi:hypothetical protein